MASSLGVVALVGAIGTRQAALHECPGVEVFRRPASGAFALAGLDLRFDRDHNLFGDPVLQFEDVIQAAVEVLGPEMVATGRIDQLSGDAQAVAGLADATFDHVSQAEFARDLGDVDRPPLVGEGRVAGGGVFEAAKSWCSSVVVQR